MNEPRIRELFWQIFLPPDPQGPDIRSACGAASSPTAGKQFLLRILKSHKPLSLQQLSQGPVPFPNPDRTGLVAPISTKEIEQQDSDCGEELQ